LDGKAIRWSIQECHGKRGVYVQRTKTTRKFTTDEIDKLPQLHEARNNPDLEVERTNVHTLKMPPILQVENIMEQNQRR